MTHHVCSVISPAEGGHGTNGILTASPEKPMKHPWQGKTHGVVDRFFQPNPLIFPHITVWGSCFSLGSHRGFPPPPLPFSHHSSQLHFSHLTLHISLITSPSSFTTLHWTTYHISLIVHHTSPHHSSQLRFSRLTHHINLRRAGATAASCVAGAVHRASWRSCGTRGRRWPTAAFGVAGAVHRASWRSCGARGRRWSTAAFCVGLLFFTWIPPLLFPPPPS